MADQNQAPTDLAPDATQKLDEIVKPNNGKINLPLIVGGVAVIAVVSAASFVYVNNNPVPESPGQAVVIPEKTLAELAAQLNLKDGTYYAEASFYVEPLGKTEHLAVTLTMADSIVTEVSVIQIDEQGNKVENEYMDKFSTSVAGLTTGKTISEIVDMDLVSGSTLSSEAFRGAMVELKPKAESTESEATTESDIETTTESS